MTGKAVVTVGAAGAAIIAVAGLLAYVPGLRVLGSLRADYIPMAPSTAGCLLILSAILFFKARRRWHGGVLRAMGALALLVTTFGMLTAAGPFTGRDLTFEAWFTRDLGTLNGIPIGRMSPIAGAAFLLAGLGTMQLVRQAAGRRHAQRAGDWVSSLGILTVLVAATVLLSYLYGDPLLYGGTAAPMAATAAVAVVCLGVALVASAGPACFPTRLFVGDSTAARLARAFVPLTMAAVMFHDATEWLGIRRVWGGGALSTALLAVVLGVLTAYVITHVSHQTGGTLDGALRKLKESETRNRAITQSANDAIITADRAGNIVAWNRGAEVMFGYTDAEVIGQPIVMLMPEESRALHSAGMQRVSSGGEPHVIGQTVEVKGTRKSGAVFPLELSLATWTSGDDQFFTGIIRDITERREAEATLRLEGAALHAVANAVVITNRAGLIEWANHAFTTFTGYRLEEAVGRTPGELLRSGAHDAAFYRALWNTVLAGDVWHGEMINRRKDGSRYTEEMTITPLPDASGVLTHFIAVKQDITERKRAEQEQERLEAQLSQAQKMESIGLLAGGVAHEFNNSLAAVLGFAELTMRKLGTGHVAYPYVEAILKSAQHSADLTSQLLAFARTQAIVLKVLDLNDTIAGMWKRLPPLLGEDVQCEWTPGHTLWPIAADATQVERVLTSLARNARDAMTTPGGRWQVSTANVVLDAAFVGLHSRTRAGEFVHLRVSDNGCGMDAQVRSHLFEPFFTTKPPGKGTGLGLSTVFGIIDQHHGFVDVESAPGAGTTVHLYFPRAGTVAEPGDAAHTVS